MSKSGDNKGCCTHMHDEVIQLDAERALYGMVYISKHDGNAAHAWATMRLTHEYKLL